MQIGIYTIDDMLIKFILLFFPVTASKLLSQTILPGVHVGCCRCIPDVDHCVTQTDIITMETCRSPSVSRHPRLAPNPDQNVTPLKYESNLAQTNSGPPRLLGVCSPALHNTAVQYVPVLPSEFANVRLPGTESGRVFWRPF